MTIPAPPAAVRPRFGVQLRPRRRSRALLLERTPAWLAALGGYALVSFFYLGIPVIAHPNRDIVGAGWDPNLFVWMLAWWPHALLHGTNPFVTHAVWAPHGVNLSWVTSVPGLALLVAPVTLLVGPVAAYNTLAVLLPALAAWTAYLLCRHVTHAFWPSLAGGYLFGFSPYMFGQTVGHPNLTAVFLVPLIALVLVRFVEGSLTGWRFVAALGGLLALQISFSTELALTLTVAIAISLALAAILVPTSRRRLRLTLLPVVASYGVAILVTAPILVYALLHFRHGAFHPPGEYPADLLNLVIPTHLTALGWSWTNSIARNFKGNAAENGAYLGLAWLAILGRFAWSFRRVAAARLLVALVAAGVVVELGVRLEVDGRRSVNLPWHLVSGLPLFNDILPVRISMFVALAASLCVAWWASSRREPRTARLVLTVLAIATVVPSLWLNVWHHRPYRPAFFTQGTYRACLKPGETVLMLPFPNRSDAMVWQAESGFDFRMANGYVGDGSPPGVPEPDLIRQLQRLALPATGQPLLRWARSQGVTTVVAFGSKAGEWRRLLVPAERAHSVDGVYLFDLRPNASGGCQSPPGRQAAPAGRFF
jgi:hypothetical protein